MKTLLSLLPAPRSPLLWLLGLLLALLPASGAGLFFSQNGLIEAITPPAPIETLELPTITTGTYVLELVGDDLTAGASVDAWASRVGGWSANQGTISKRPLVVAAAIGGRNAVRFDRVDDALSITSFNPGGLSAVTIFLVANITSSGGDDIIFEASANYNANNGTFIFYKTSANRAFLAAQEGGNNNTFQTTSTYVGAAYVFTGIDDKSLSTNEATVWVDGVSSGTRPLNANLGSIFSTHTSYIGARGGTSLFTGMDLAALVICSGALDTTDRQAVEAALTDYFFP